MGRFRARRKKTKGGGKEGVYRGKKKKKEGKEKKKNSAGIAKQRNFVRHLFGRLMMPAHGA